MDITTQNLDLSDNQLTSLPAEIAQIENLTGLDLSYNQLSSLPAEIGQLQNLTELDLNRNQLTSLPAQTGQLQNLTTLSLGDNQLSSLPAEIGQLQNLTYLNLYDNQLSSLPSGIAQLENLGKFFCDPQKIKVDNKRFFRSRGNEPRIFVRLEIGKIVCGCFRGTVKQFVQAVENKYGNMSNYCPEFIPFLNT